MYGDLPDPEWDAAHAALFQKLAEERTPCGALESEWLSQIVHAAMKNDVAAMKIATFSFLRLQFIRNSKDDVKTSLLFEGT